MSDRREDLIPLSPAEGVQRFLGYREPSVSKSTFHNNKTTLEQFAAWCREEGIDNLNDLNGRDLADFVAWRRGEVKPITLQKNLSAVRVALEYWADIEAVVAGLREQVHAPTLPDGAEARDVKVDRDIADSVLGYLGKHRYASREHAILSLMWRTGMRLGTIRSLDVADLVQGEAALDVHHRPSSETPLKNGPAGERWVWLGDAVMQTLVDYRDIHRDDVRDGHNRQPLFTSRYGRLSDSAIRDTSYRWTQPCRWSTCPHGREQATCEAYGAKNLPSKCPSARSPHGWRRGAITDHLARGVSAEIVSERMNVSLEVLYRHYDARDEGQKMAVRREELERRLS